MNGIALTGSGGAHYFYDDDSGIIFPGRGGAAPYSGRIEVSPLGLRQPPPSRVAADAIRRHHLDFAYGFRHLILEVTAQCNLRCRYCVYSDHYAYNRDYSDGRMSGETARAAIDLFMQNHVAVHRRNPSSRPIIGFYGGEPLLAFGVIREAVDHFRDRWSKSFPDALFTVTTNGTLLTDEIQDFLVERGFSTIFSLDGPKEDHDRNRVTVGGDGSFEAVWANLRRFRERHPGYEQLAVSTCYDYGSDFDRLMRFFDQERLFVVNISQVNPNATTYYAQFSTADRDAFCRRRDEFHRKFVDAARENRIEKGTFLFSYVGVSFANFAFHPVMNERRPTFLPYTSTCVPGEKVYVDTGGTLHMCERVNPHFSIGSVRDGVDYQRIAEIVDRYNAGVCGRCADCPVTRFCDRCFATTGTDGGFAVPPGYCERMVETVRRSLVEYVDIAEGRPEILDDITVEYHRDLLRRVGYAVE
jgi:uncharacterized protein